MPRRAVGIFAAFVLLVSFVSVSWAAPREAPPDPNAPPTPAEKIAGRWRITLEGLASEHQEIVASLAIDGEMLIGTLTVGTRTVHITSGRVVGAAFTFALPHGEGELFKMRGSAGEKGLSGVWEAAGETGKWRASRI